MKFQGTYLVVFSLVLPSPLLVGAGTSRTPTTNGRHLSRALQRIVVDHHTNAILNDGASAGSGMTMMVFQKVLQAQEMLEGSLVHRRELQSASTCDSLFVEFWEDQTLNDAFTVYWSSRSDSNAALLKGDSSCQVDDIGDIYCDLDVPINGETAFKSACAIAGGRIVTFSLDVSCTLTGQSGATNSIHFDDPVALSCIPGTSSFDSCHDSILVVYNSLGDDEAADLETAFLQEGSFTSASCRNVGDDANILIEDNGGSGEDEVVVDNGASTTEEDEVVVDTADESTNVEENEVVDNGSGSSKVLPQGIGWFASAVIMMVSLFGSVNDII